MLGVGWWEGYDGDKYFERFQSSAKPLYARASSIFKEYKKALFLIDSGFVEAISLNCTKSKRFSFFGYSNKMTRGTAKTDRNSDGLRKIGSDSDGYQSNGSNELGIGSSSSSSSSSGNSVASPKTKSFFLAQDPPKLVSPRDVNQLMNGLFDSEELDYLIYEHAVDKEPIKDVRVISNATLECYSQFSVGRNLSENSSNRSPDGVANSVLCVLDLYFQKEMKAQSLEEKILCHLQYIDDEISRRFTLRMHLEEWQGEQLLKALLQLTGVYGIYSLSKRVLIDLEPSRFALLRNSTNRKWLVALPLLALPLLIVVPLMIDAAIAATAAAGIELKENSACERALMKLESGEARFALNKTSGETRQEVVNTDVEKASVDALDVLSRPNSNSICRDTNGLPPSLAILQLLAKLFNEYDDSTKTVLTNRIDTTLDMDPTSTVRRPVLRHGSAFNNPYTEQVLKDLVTKPVLDEIICRGFLLRSLCGYTNPVLAVILSILVSLAVEDTDYDLAASELELSYQDAAVLFLVRSIVSSLLFISTGTIFFPAVYQCLWRLKYLLHESADSSDILMEATFMWRTVVSFLATEQSYRLRGLMASAGCKIDNSQSVSVGWMLNSENNQRNFSALHTDVDGKIRKISQAVMHSYSTDHYSDRDKQRIMPLDLIDFIVALEKAINDQIFGSETSNSKKNKLSLYLNNKEVGSIDNVNRLGCIDGRDSLILKGCKQFMRLGENSAYQPLMRWLLRDNDIHTPEVERLMKEESQRQDTKKLVEKYYLERQFQLYVQRETIKQLVPSEGFNVSELHMFLAAILSQLNPDVLCRLDCDKLIVALSFWDNSADSVDYLDFLDNCFKTVLVDHDWIITNYIGRHYLLVKYMAIGHSPLSSRQEILAGLQRYNQSYPTGISARHTAVSQADRGVTNRRDKLLFDKFSADDSEVKSLRDEWIKYLRGEYHEKHRKDITDKEKAKYH